MSASVGAVVILTKLRQTMDDEELLLRIMEKKEHEQEARMRSKIVRNANYALAIHYLIVRGSKGDAYITAKNLRSVLRLTQQGTHNIISDLIDGGLLKKG